MRREAVRLGDTLAEVFGGALSNNQEKLARVSVLWREIVPAELCEHCQVVAISGTVIKVQVDLPIYAYQLRLCSDELLAKLQGRLGRTGVSEVSVILKK